RAGGAIFDRDDAGRHMHGWQLDRQYFQSCPLCIEFRDRGRKQSDKSTASDEGDGAQGSGSRSASFKPFRRAHLLLLPATTRNGSANSISDLRSSAVVCGILPINKSILRSRSS